MLAGPDIMVLQSKAMAPTTKLTALLVFVTVICPYVLLTVATVSDSFVWTRGSQFSLNGRSFYVNGFNAYYLMYESVDGASRSMVSQFLQQAASTGLTVARTWAFNDGGYRALQISPGVYDETVFRGLDYVVNEAQYYGLRLILSLSNNYPNMGGKQQYVEWGRNAGLSLSSDDAFFTDPTVKGYYKNFVQAVLTRVNSFSGVAYKDDPTILAWELMNEPRCPSDTSGDTLYAWIEEMSAYVKSIDANHLLEVGLEGFYGPSTPEQENMNPASMISVTGTDYVRFSRISSIDFTTVHSYPDLWLPNAGCEGQIAFLTSWVASHITDAYAIQKPVLFAEFGMSSYDADFSEENRVALFTAMYATVYSSARLGGPAAGSLLWQLCPEELEYSMATDGYGVTLSSPTGSVVAGQSRRLLILNEMD